jgi:5-methyltetrahydropteroyltriglutamate--homocysteine methyltransferase
MAQLLIANVGSLPRVGDDKDEQRHRRARGHFERKEISAHAFRDVEQSITQELIQRQLSCGLDEITDGLIGWDDPITPFVKNITNISWSGWRRYYDFDFYYRRPQLAASSKPKGNWLAPLYRSAQDMSDKPVRVVLTGPLTLALHCDAKTKTLGNLAKRAAFFAHVLNREIAAAHKEGAAIFQIDEPALAAQHQHAALVSSLLHDVRHKIPTAKFILKLHYFPLAALWPKLQSMPVEGINVDMTQDEGPLLAAMKQNPGDKEIGFGIANALTTKADDVDRTVALLTHWSEHSSAARFFVTPSSGLEHLPRRHAYQKLRFLADVKAQFHG